MKKKSTSNRNTRRKETIKYKGTLAQLPQIQVMLNLTKKDMETLLKSPAMGINKVLYDVPVFQIKRYLAENKTGVMKFTLNKAKNQNPNQINKINE